MILAQQSSLIYCATSSVSALQQSCAFNKVDYVVKFMHILCTQTYTKHHYAQSMQNYYIKNCQTSHKTSQIIVLHQ
jgi:hypothetical protein